MIANSLSCSLSFREDSEAPGLLSLSNTTRVIILGDFDIHVVILSKPRSISHGKECSLLLQTNLDISGA